MKVHSISEAREDRSWDLPHNIDLEQTLLGTILFDNVAFDRVASFLEREDFYEPFHRELFRVIKDLITAKKPANPVTVIPYIPAEEKLGEVTVKEYVAHLATQGMHQTAAYGFGVELRGLGARRQAIEKLRQSFRDLHDPDPSYPVTDILKDVEEHVSEVRAMTISKRSPTSYQSTFDNYLDELGVAYETKEIIGCPVPLKAIQDVLGEPVLARGELYGLLGGTGEGKTVLILQFVREQIENGHPCLFITFDQEANQIHQQMMAQETGLQMIKQRKGDFTDKDFAEIHKYREARAEAMCEIIQVSGIKATHLGSLIRRPLREFSSKTNKTPLIILDHVGRLTPHDERAHEGRIAKYNNAVCKDHAKEFGGAWLNVNQRNSGGLGSDNPFPTQRDVYGKRDALQDYAAMLYIYRREYYLEQLLKGAEGKEEDRLRQLLEMPKVKGKALIGALKVRYARNSIARLVDFNAQFTRYEDPAIQQTPDLEGGFVF